MKLLGNTFLSTFIGLFASSLLTFDAFASPIAGAWEAELQVTPQMTLPLVLRVEFEDDNWQAELDSPVQSANGMQTSKLEVEEAYLMFELEHLGVHFSGNYDSSNDSISGTFIQGKPMPLTFVREYQREIPDTFAIDTMEQLLGEWRGRIQSIKLPFVLNVEEVEGTYKAQARSPLQGDESIEVSRFELKNGELYLEIDALDVYYQAKISTDSQALAGEFTQRELSSALVLDKQI